MLVGIHGRNDFWQGQFLEPDYQTIRLFEDQRNWVEVARNERNTGSIDVSFSPRPARFIRIEQTGCADRWWWSIHRVGIE
jgi:hypothetical protein